MRKGNTAVNEELEHSLDPKDKPQPGGDREVLENFIHSKYVLRNFVEGGSGKVDDMPGRKDEKRSKDTIGMVVRAVLSLFYQLRSRCETGTEMWGVQTAWVMQVMIGVMFTTIKRVNDLSGVSSVEGQIDGAPRGGATRNKPKKDKKSLVWNEMVQLQVAGVDGKSNNMVLKVNKVNKPLDHGHL
jgi:hypothetical protein